jgi:transcriptional regulator with XRE-family HTH domain
MVTKKTPQAQERPATSAAAAIPSAQETANVAAFDELAQSLGLTSGAARPRRWISRIGGLLRNTRALQKVGQSELAQRAELTQPYLSRLENGLLPKRGPTVDVLMRFAEAMGCDINISLRAKQTGELLGSVSTADLETVSPRTDSARPSEPAHTSESLAAIPVTLPEPAPVRDVMNLVIGQQRGNTPPEVVQVEVKRESDGRVYQVSLKQPEPSRKPFGVRMKNSFSRRKFMAVPVDGQFVPVLRMDRRSRKSPIGGKGGVTVGKYGIIVIGKSGTSVYENAPDGRPQKVRIRSSLSSPRVSKEEHDG